ncbi:MAG: division/cell wall cluster transcriptional repressor MraZ [Candidatus Eisenbacteria bacterium]|nr:division/cell wall cluster transcriptional repressor MraZ [Candidatus Eisenbacteria bacterium]
MATFRGRYLNVLDHKGRLNIPSKFRRALSPDAQNTFVIIRGLDGCISLYPLDEWVKIEAKLRSLPVSKENSRKFQRIMHLDSADATLDSQGRIALPPALVKQAKISKDVVVFGILDRIELWNPKLFEQYFARSGQSYEETAEDLLF